MHIRAVAVKTVREVDNVLMRQRVGAESGERKLVEAAAHQPEPRAALAPLRCTGYGGAVMSVSV